MPRCPGARGTAPLEPESVDRNRLNIQYTLDQRGKPYWIEYQEGVRSTAYSVEFNEVLDDAGIRGANLELGRAPDYIADRARAADNGKAGRDERDLGGSDLED